MSSRATANPGAFRDRFALEKTSDGAVLVNLETGACFQLNSTAAEVCRALEGAPAMSEAASELGRRLGISRAEAGALLADMVRDLEQPGTRDDVIGPFRYLRDGDGYALHEGAQPVLAVARDGSALELRAPFATLRFQPIDYVRAVTPKILSLQGVRVLHASSVTLPSGALVAFAGTSGAGKTTTALAFASSGGALVSEDLNVLAPAREGPAVYEEGERRAHAWADEIAARLARTPDARVPCDGLAAVPEGKLRPLAEVWFLDAARRGGDTLERRHLPPTAGLLALIRNTFIGGADPASWRRHLADARALAASVGLWEATPPRGLEALSRAAAAYRVSSAS